MTNFASVSITKAADTIVVLEKGGNMSYVGLPRSYPGSLLSIIETDHDDEAEKDEITKEVNGTAAAPNGPGPLNNSTIQPAQNTVTGEVGDWKYYYDIIGPLYVFFALLLTAGSIMPGAFGGKFGLTQTYQVI
jgi:hypothetical protein